MIIDFIIEDLMLNSYLQKNFHTLLYKPKTLEDSSPRAKASISHALKNTHFQAVIPLNFPSGTTTSCGLFHHILSNTTTGI